MSPPELSEELLRTAFSTNPSEAEVDDATTDAIWRAVEGSCAAEELGALLRRAREEPAVAEAWRMAQAVHAEVVDEANEAAPSGEVVAGPTHWWRRPAVVGMGTAVALAAAVLLVVQTGEVPREGGPMRAETAELASTLSSTELPRDHAILRWTATDDGSVYSVTVTTDALQPVAQTGGLRTPEWQIPADTLAAFPVGTVVLWRVEALLPDGTRHRSATFEGVLR
jgi:hypothetical protein